MGTVFKRNKHWYISYCYNGKRYKKSVAPSKKLAELALSEIEIKIAKGELGFLPKDSDLEKLFNEFSEYSKTNHAPSSVKRYRAVLDHFKGFLTTYHPVITKVSLLAPGIFEHYKRVRKSQNVSKDKKVNPRTINFELQTLKSVFALAIRWGYLSNNPVEGVELFKVIKAKEQRFLTKEEIDKLLVACSEWQYPIFYTFLHTGMRKQELMNLEWQDVDIARGIIKIRVKDDWTPKTSERHIPINKGLLKLLKDHKEKTEHGRFVFHDGEGNKIENNKLRKELMKLTKEYGFPDVTKIHSLRHTWASHLVMNGVDLPSVQRLMGHSNIDTTMIYAHLAQDHLSKAVEKVDY